MNNQCPCLLNGVTLCRLYFVPLVIVLVAESHKHHFTDVVNRKLRDPMTYVELVAEITLANVVVSDLMYTSIG